MQFDSTFRQRVRLVPLTWSVVASSVGMAGCGGPATSSPTRSAAKIQTSKQVEHEIRPANSTGGPARPIAESDFPADPLVPSVRQRPDHPLPAAGASQPPSPLALRQEAIAVAERLVERYPENADALEIKARFMLLLGDSQRAQQCWRQALRIAPEYAYALHGLGRVAILEGRYEEALGWLQRSIPKQPGVAEPVHDLADAYTKLGRLDEAIATLRGFVESSPQSMLSWLLLGQAYQLKQQHSQAEQAFRSALRLAPGTARAQQGLATVLLRLGKREESLKILAELRAVRSDDSASESLAHAYQEEKKEIALRFVGVAEIHYSHGDFNQAEQVIRRAVELDPLHLRAKSLLAKVYQQQSRLPEAIAVMRELQIAEPQNPSWPYTLGALLAHSGDRAAALQEYREVIRLAPDDPLGYEALTRLLISQASELPQAIECAQRVVQLRGTAADHELLAQCYALNADYSRAEQSLQQAMRLDPANPLYPQALQQVKQFLGGGND